MQWLIPLVLTSLLIAEDATHLLTPPPPVECEEREGVAPLKPDDIAARQTQEKQKREALEKPLEIETQENGEGDIEKIIKNPKFKVNIPF